MCESLMKSFWFLNWHCITYLCRCPLTGANISTLAGRSWYKSTNLFKADRQWFNAEILKLIQVASKHRLDRHTAHLPNIDKVRLCSYFGATLEARHWFKRPTRVENKKILPLKRYHSELWKEFKLSLRVGLCDSLCRDKSYQPKKNRLCSHYTRLLFVPTWKIIWYSLNTNGPGRHTSFTHFEHQAGTVSREGLVNLNPSPHSWIYFRLSGFQSSLLLIYFRVGPIGVRTALKNGTIPIRYETRHFLDRHGAAPLCHRNCAEITVLVCEQNPYWQHFPSGAKATRYGVNRS